MKDPPKRRPYRRSTQPSIEASVSLAPDSVAAVVAIQVEYNLSRSGAIHHLLRLGANLPPLI
jgi:hypothetical protein